MSTRTMHRRHVSLAPKDQSLQWASLLSPEARQTESTSPPEHPRDGPNLLRDWQQRPVHRFSDSRWRAGKARQEIASAQPALDVPEPGTLYSFPSPLGSAPVLVSPSHSGDRAAGYAGRSVGLSLVFPAVCRLSRV